jgi:hypothetical protein
MNDEIEDSGEVYESLRQLAAAIPRSVSTLSGWRERDDWPQTVRVTPPWTEMDAEILQQWAEANLQENRAAEDEPESRFWKMHCRHKAVTLPRADGVVVKDDWKALPTLCVPKGMKAILEGKRKLTPGEVKELIRLLTRLFTSIVEDLDMLPGWLRGQSQSEIGAMMRGAIYDRLLWFGDAVGRLDEGEDGGK